MNGGPVCTPTQEFLDSKDGDDDGRLLKEYSDAAEDVLPGDTDMNGCTTVDDECERLTDPDSEVDGCDDVADDSPNHRLITQCQQSNSMALDLSRRGLKSFCRRLLTLSQLQVIYLFITCLLTF